MKGRLPIPAERRTLADAMRRRSPRPSGPPPAPQRRGPDGRVPADELQAWRVAWGRYFGGRIRDLTRDWKREAA